MNREEGEEEKEGKKNRSGLDLFRRSPLCLSLQIFSFLLKTPLLRL